MVNKELVADLVSDIVKFKIMNPKIFDMINNGGMRAANPLNRANLNWIASRYNRNLISDLNIVCTENDMKEHALFLEAIIKCADSQTIELCPALSYFTNIEMHISNLASTFNTSKPTKETYIDDMENYDFRVDLDIAIDISKGIVGLISTTDPAFCLMADLNHLPPILSDEKYYQTTIDNITATLSALDNNVCNCMELNHDYQITTQNGKTYYRRNSIQQKLRSLRENIRGIKDYFTDGMERSFYKAIKSTKLKIEAVKLLATESEKMLPKYTQLSEETLKVLRERCM